MIKALTKKITLILLLNLLSSQLVHAEIKNYQYDGKLPFVQMMLSMMVAMGILDRVPVSNIYNRYGSYGMLNNRYAQLWANKNGFDRGGYDSSGFGRWGDSRSVDWGQPRWGVLPEESYSLNGWVNEPWELSVWNNKKQDKQEVAVHHHNDISAETSYKNQPHQSSLKKSSLDNKQKNKQAKKSKQSTKLKQKACVTDFCGLQAPNLNGLWLSREGELLGVKNNNYLWSDGQSRHLTGNIKLQNDYLLVSADGYQQSMRFKYKLDGRYLLTMQPDGKIREFKRVSNGSGDYGQGSYDNNSRSSDGYNNQVNRNFRQGKSRNYY
jgi:hypothetical protein